MTVQLSDEQEAQLYRMANQTGRSADDLAREAVERYLAEEGLIHAAVRVGQEAAARGDFVPALEVWARVERALKI
jgi:predicted transcriptional regulator